jgi:uncharacterized protein YbcI
LGFAIAEGAIEDNLINNPNPTVAQHLAQAVRVFQQQQTGYLPKSVTVVRSEDTLVVTLHSALSPAQRAWAPSSQDAADLQEYHRQLFRNSADSLWKEMARISGRPLREGVVEIDPANGCIVHAFTTETTLQVFLSGESGSDEICATDSVPALA